MGHLTAVALPFFRGSPLPKNSLHSHMSWRTIQTEGQDARFLKDYPREADILPLKTEFMLRLNAGRFTRESSMTLCEFVEKIYLPYVEELRASTKKGYREILDQSHFEACRIDSYEGVPDRRC